MDLIDSMRVLDRVIERRSFGAAATDLGLSRSTVTQAIKQLEARLGTRLLERNTRHVLPTLDGAAYHRRCVSILAELEDAENALSSTEPRGRLRIDVNGNTPTSLEALAGHGMVGFVSSASGEVMPLRFIVGAEMRAVPLPARITVNGGATMQELGRLGFGLIQAPRFAIADDLRDGRLVALLAGFPPPALPLIALYPHSRHLAPRVRVFVDWLAAIFAGRDVTAALGAAP